VPLANQKLNVVKAKEAEKSKLIPDQPVEENDETE
jgi:hypothetical protein